MLAWSPGTNGRPVKAEAIILPRFSDSTEFVKWLPQAKGKVVLLSPAWPTCRPSEDWNRWGTAESVARMQAAIADMQRDWAVMNAAMILYAGGKAPSIHTAFPLAQEALASGAAKRKLEELAQS